MDITGGFNIAPADPNAEKAYRRTGLLPLFNRPAGRSEVRGLRPRPVRRSVPDGLFHNHVGHPGISTQAILVTGNDGIDVGTKPGQTPPVGTVYNVAYFFSDKTGCSTDAAGLAT